MRNRTPTKGIKAGDIVRPTVEAMTEIPFAAIFDTATVTAVKKHSVEGKIEPSLVLIAYEFRGEMKRDALHETWLERLP